MDLFTEAKCTCFTCSQVTITMTIPERLRTVLLKVPDLLRRIKSYDGWQHFPFLPTYTLVLYDGRTTG